MSTAPASPPTCILRVSSKKHPDASAIVEYREGLLHGIVFDDPLGQWAIDARVFILLAARHAMLSVNASAWGQFCHESTPNKPLFVVEDVTAAQPPPPFDDFWKWYPLPKAEAGSKSKAATAWAKLSPADQRAAFAALAAFAARKKKKGEFLPHGVTYLNQRLWDF